MEKPEHDIDSLARMVAEGFSAMERRFEEGFGATAERFTALETRFDTLEKEVRTTNQHIDRVMMPLLDSHAHRIKALEVKLA